MTPDDATPAPFHDLEQYIALPRLSGLVLAPDGSRLVTSVATLDPARTGYVTALWEVDPEGHRPARRLTRSGKGEQSPSFTAGGDLLFTSARPDPQVAADDDTPAALWLLPAGGGEARVVASRTAGVSAPRAAAGAPVVLVSSGVLPSATDADHDDELRAERKKKKVSAILHTGYPVRYWDHDLGPADPHLFLGALPGVGGVQLHGEIPGVAAIPEEVDPAITLRDLTPDAGTALREQSATLSDDGTTVVATWIVAESGGGHRTVLMAIDTATGERRVLVDDGESSFGSPRIAPDGSRVAFVRESRSTGERAPAVTLGVVDLLGGPTHQLAGGWDRWPSSITWLPDSSGLLLTADDDGRGPIFHLALGEGDSAGTDGSDVTRVTSDDAVFTDVQISPDGSRVYALRVSYLEPPVPVVVDLAAALATGAPVPATALPGPTTSPTLPGVLTEVETTAADGSRVRAFLALPHGAGPETPAPLLLWIHGGPLNSWNAWSWRWNPWLLVAQGYAVLLPDPALSTGYGQEFIQRGWGAWGQAPYTDLMAITDAAEALPEIDETRTAAMGGSFGGYMANWVAGHTDRFKAIVTHASLWALDQFGPTTDSATYWEREMTPEMALANSPHLFVENIVTPMLVVHGDKDYRVPIGEGLRLWYELLAKSGLPADANGETVHRFLYYPDENHWVLSPQNAIVWYEVVEAFLADHVLGESHTLPKTLG
ncbi:Dipeptidyl aminopeptidase/acylaminoacyl peptidase [Sanguibacter gelidistatuariae]|uniref:Dipeptidyl aminopeptidase/acylaminoacyl peptidase n=1 Tax=Sanguibacter gelidistatuariae TaxID=1814289 RepID=A0A1G6HAQ8_9MICO|nr:alpha/beta fold hydrolase [Sanguibacter gelidistatuariae]SDB91301.1 Dipeptidyl aminopeptidase/acylaminoacyl peptidase [Sanguibacter gelidistatuariae]